MGRSTGSVARTRQDDTRNSQAEGGFRVAKAYLRLHACITLFPSTGRAIIPSGICVTAIQRKRFRRHWTPNAFPHLLPLRRLRCPPRITVTLLLPDGEQKPSRKIHERRGSQRSAILRLNCSYTRTRSIRSEDTRYQRHPREISLY